MYRSQLDGRGGNSLGEAVIKGLPAGVLDQSRHAFTSGLHLAAAITAITLTAMATLLAVTLRKQPALGLSGDDEAGGN